MKKLLFLAVFTATLAISCKKSNDPAPGGGADPYMSISAGSTWNYQFVDNMTPANSNNYTVTSTTRDTTAAGKTYHVFSNSNGRNEYYNITGSDYFRLQALSLGITDTTIVNLYLKDAAAVNTSWNQSYLLDAGLPTLVEIIVTNKIQEKGITKTVGLLSYSNVIHVVTTISIPTITLLGGSITTDIHYYYAPKYGMIQNDAKIDLVVAALSLDQHTNTQTKLLGATIL